MMAKFDLDIIRKKLSSYGVGHRDINDEMFTNCPIDDIFNEPATLAEDFITSHFIDEALPCQVPGCLVISKSLKDSEAHYNLAHRHTCSQCKRRLPSAHLLDLHLSEVHDSFFAVLSEKKPSFACYVQECDVKSMTPQDRHKHCVEDHKFPSNFKYEVLDHKKKRKNKKQSNKNKPTDGNNPTTENSLNNNNIEPMEVNQGTDEKKKYNFFNFGHSQTKSFEKPWHAKKSHKHKKEKKANETASPSISALEYDDLMIGLKDTLAEIIAEDAQECF